MFLNKHKHLLSHYTEDERRQVAFFPLSIDSQLYIPEKGSERSGRRRQLERHTTPLLLSGHLCS